MAVIGYVLVDEKGTVVKTWGGGKDMPPFPNPLYLPNGDAVSAPKLGESYNGFILSEMRGEIAEDVPGQITRRQCALQLLEDELINGPEAVEMVRNGIPPKLIADYFSTLPESSQYIAAIDFAADTYLRSNPLLEMLAASQSVELDTFFKKAAKK